MSATILAVSDDQTLHSAWRDLLNHDPDPSSWEKPRTENKPCTR
jgi:hypothetical protein